MTSKDVIMCGDKLGEGVKEEGERDSKPGVFGLNLPLARGIYGVVPALASVNLSTLPVSTYGMRSRFLPWFYSSNVSGSWLLNLIVSGINHYAMQPRICYLRAVVSK